MKEDRTLNVVVHCVQCHEEVVLKVRPCDWILFNSPNRPHVQECFPYLTAEEREMFISGLCPKCWSALFDSIDEDDEEVEDYE